MFLLISTIFSQILQKQFNLLINFKIYIYKTFVDKSIIISCIIKNPKFSKNIVINTKENKIFLQIKLCIIKEKQKLSRNIMFIRENLTLFLKIKLLLLKNIKILIQMK
jgi:hypothetical protein